MTPRRTVVLLTSFALGFLSTGICLGQPNRAAAFGWRSSVDTDLAFSELGSDDYTLMATFMLQYPNAYTGPILSVNGAGTFLIGQSDALDTKGGEPGLTVDFGAIPSGTLSELGPQIAEPRWGDAPGLSHM